MPVCTRGVPFVIHRLPQRQLRTQSWNWRNVELNQWNRNSGTGERSKKSGTGATGARFEDGIGAGIVGAGIGWIRMEASRIGGGTSVTRVSKVGEARLDIALLQKIL